MVGGCNGGGGGGVCVGCVGSVRGDIFYQIFFMHQFYILYD